jgi:hypothetical protein
MDTNTTIVIVVAVIAVAAVVYLLMRRRNSSKLRGQFGPEYERTVDEVGGRRKAELELQNRAKRVKTFELTPLTVGDRERYGLRWRNVQGEFVDNPKGAVTHADELLGEVMTARGYPTGEFEQQAADLSVDHPVFVQNYRAAHEIAVRHAQGEAGTEDLRQAMIHYRTLFDELVHEQDPAITAKAS